MPVGIPKKVYKEDLTFFGFGQYNIVCPKSQGKPFLPIRSSNGSINSSQVFQTGAWTGWYFSEEIKHARTLGYSCEFVKGYHFDKNGTQFTGYIVDLYNIKSTTQDKILKQIAKLQQNSLYGRWGLNTENNQVLITKDITEVDRIKEMHQIINEDILVVDNINYYYIIYSNELNKACN